MRVGLIGLGIMGRPMAKNLLQKGTDLFVYDIAEDPILELEALGAKRALPSVMGGNVDVLLTILPNGSTVKDVLFGENGAAARLRPGTVVVDMSSVTPRESRDCWQRLQAVGVHFLDAPVSGGEPKAVDGTLAFMVGGDQEAYDRVLPLLLQMGANAVLVGPSGSGSVTKLANQIVVNLNIAALGEALVFATKAGVDPEKVFAAIRGGLAGSTVMEAKAPMMLNRDFRPGGKISVNHKDIRNVVDTAHDMDIPVPMSAQLFEVMQALKIRDLMEEDHSALVKHFEALAAIHVQKGGASS